jgi:hypothetical protein
VGATPRWQGYRKGNSLTMPTNSDSHTECTTTRLVYRTGLQQCHRRIHLVVRSRSATPRWQGYRNFVPKPCVRTHERLGRHSMRHRKG